MNSHTLFLTLFVLVAVVVGLAASTQPDYVPQQIHLSYGYDSTEMRVTWASTNGSESLVLVGSQPNLLNSVVSAESHYWLEGNQNGTHWVHRATIKNLIAGKLYYYRVQTGRALSPILAFRAKREPSADWRPRFLVFADMGRDGGAPSLDRMIKEVGTGNITAVIHAGDFAYDMSSEGGERGADFMRLVEPMTAYVPYMTAPGNHEKAFNFSNYLNTFNMPTERGANPRAMWYSWDINNIHFVSYDTELYYSGGPIDEQFAWLDQDLARANENRANVPWIIAYGHRPMYCSNNDPSDCSAATSAVRLGLEDLFFKHGVDLIINGHEHAYERMWPVYNQTVTQYDYINPRAPVQIISGAAGCQSGLCEDPLLGPGGPWSAFRSWFLSYGFGHLEVHNSTHLYWDQVLDTTGEVLDSIWIVQEKHGPFKPL